LQAVSGSRFDPEYCPNGDNATPPTKRAELTPADIDAELRKPRDQAKLLRDGLSASLEKALSGDKDFLIHLELYARHPEHEQ